MRSYIKNTIKDRLTYCKDWKNSVDIYLANKQISKKTHQEYYKSKPLLKLLLDLYFLPYNLLRFFKYLRMLHEYKKNETEIQVLSRELRNNEDQ